MPHTFLPAIKSKLPEYAIVVLAKARAFLITKIFDLINEVLQRLRDECPPPDVLNSLLALLNTIEGVVTGVKKTIDKIAKLPPLLDGAIAACKVYLDIQYHIRPDFVAALFATHPFTFLRPTPFIKLNNLQKRIRKVEAILEDLQTAKATIKFAVSVTNGVLGPILGVIAVIRSLIEACFNKQDLTDEERKAIIDEIQGKTSEILSRGIPYTSSTGVTYTIKVINDPNSPSVAQKRQAIALDFRGIVILTGPTSFASDPNILIEELKFRLDLIGQPPPEPNPRPKPRRGRDIGSEQNLIENQGDPNAPKVTQATSNIQITPTDTKKPSTTPTPTPEKDQYKRTRRRKRRFSEVFSEYRKLVAKGLDDDDIRDRLRDYGANRYQIARVM